MYLAKINLPSKTKAHTKAPPPKIVDCSFEHKSLFCILIMTHFLHLVKFYVNKKTATCRFVAYRSPVQTAKFDIINNLF